MKKEFAMYAWNRLRMVNGRCVKVVGSEMVRVMARAEGYAMVRLKGSMPFLCAEKDLTPVGELPR